MSSLVSRLYNWVTDKGNNVKITASRVDAENDQVITALNRKVLCASSAPGSPIAGQTWIDTTNKLLKVYRNNEWVIMGAVHVSATGSVMATPQEGDLWYDTTTNKLQAYNGSTWDVIESFTPTAANALAGSVVQVVNLQTQTPATGTTLLPYDNTNPQYNEGDEVMSLAITPKSASNKLRIDVVCYANSGGHNQVIAALFKDASAINSDSLAVGCESNTNEVPQPIVFTYYMTAGGTSATTFTVRIGDGFTSGVGFNRRYAANYFGGAIVSSITISEIKV